MNAGTDSKTKILVTTNLPAVLRRELARQTLNGERVAIGTATDPYQASEGQCRITRRALEESWLWSSASTSSATACVTSSIRVCEIDERGVPALGANGRYA